MLEEVREAGRRCIFEFWVRLGEQISNRKRLENDESIDEIKDRKLTRG